MTFCDASFSFLLVAFSSSDKASSISPLFDYVKLGLCNPILTDYMIID